MALTQAQIAQINAIRSSIADMADDSNVPGGKGNKRIKNIDAKIPQILALIDQLLKT